MEHPYQHVPLVMLSGVGRSGTNALRAALGAHPDIDSTGCENNIAGDLLEVCLHNRTAPSRRFGMRTSEAEYDRLFRQMILSLLWPAPRRPAPAAALAYSNLTPAAAEELLRLFAGSQIVYPVRSGVEVVASRMLYPAFAEQPFEEHCRVWLRSAEMAAWAASPGPHRERILIVRHERLREHPAGEIGRTLEHLRLAPRDACLAPLQTLHIPTQAAGEDPGAAADLGRRAERAAGWTAGQRDTFERLCGEAMRRLGYPLP